MRSYPRVLLTAVLLCASASMADAQRRTTILVETGDAVSGIFLPSVQIQIASLKLTQHTDSLGEARFTGVPPGKYTIEARRVGFQPLSAPVLIAGQDSFQVSCSCVRAWRSSTRSSCRSPAFRSRCVNSKVGGNEDSDNS